MGADPWQRGYPNAHDTTDVILAPSLISFLRPSQEDGTPVLHNHLRFIFRHDQDAKGHARIVGFNVEPFSVKHSYDGAWHASGAVPLAALLCLALMHTTSRLRCRTHACVLLKPLHATTRARRAGTGRFASSEPWWADRRKDGGLAYVRPGHEQIHHGAGGTTNRGGW